LAKKVATPAESQRPKEPVPAIKSTKDKSSAESLSPKATVPAIKATKNNKFEAPGLEDMDEWRTLYEKMKNPGA
jgi:hypothetical protein